MHKIEKIRHISKQFVRYFGVALIGYVFDFGTLILMHGVLHINTLIAASCGFTIGLIVLYFLSNKYVFGESKIKSRAKEFGVFALIGLIGLGILNLLMWFMTDQHQVNYLISKIVATVFVYAWNFFARRTLYHDNFIDQSKPTE
jgi:putative flippase GtrA